MGLASAALFGACGGTCAPEAKTPLASAPPIVIWIEVDTLRADALGCYGNPSTGENGCAPSPNLDALANDGVRFEHAYSAAPWTIPSFVTQLSGLWPWEHGATHLLEPIGEAHTALVPLLARAGLRTGGVMTNFVATSRYGLGRGFERWDDSLATGHEGSSSPEALQKLLAMADDLGGGRERGLFLMGWLFEPHYRYEPHAGLRFGPGFGAASATPYTGPLKGDEPLEKLLRERARFTPADQAFIRGNYQSEVAFLDASIGRFVAGLKQRGLYDRAWIVFTADHGEELFDRGWLGHSVTLFDELVRVPLIVKPPRGTLDEAAVRSDFVSLIDVPATLFTMATGHDPERAGLQLGHSRSLLPTIVKGRASERRWLYLHTNFEPVIKDDLAGEKSALKWGVIDAQSGWKWFVDHATGAAPQARLFDLKRDPLERSDIAGDPAHAGRVVSFQRVRALEPRILGRERPAPAWLPEEPWGPRAATTDGFGPGFTASER